MRFDSLQLPSDYLHAARVEIESKAMDNLFFAQPGFIRPRAGQKRKELERAHDYVVNLEKDHCFNSAELFRSLGNPENFLHSLETNDMVLGLKNERPVRKASPSKSVVYKVNES